MAQDPIDDVIILEGQNFAVKGNVQGNAVSEFETGIKVGPPTNDQREHAFFLGLNDFSGGFGSRMIDIREEQGNFWYPEDNSPETAFAGRITLPLKQELIPITNGPDYAYLGGDISKAWTVHSTGYLFALGTAVYRILGLSDDPDRLIQSPIYVGERYISSLVHVVTTKFLVRSRYAGNPHYYYTTTTPQDRLYFCYGGGTGNPILSTNSGVSWGAALGQVAQEPGPDDVTDLSINIVSKTYKANKGVQLVPAATNTGGLGIQPSNSVGAVRYNIFATFNGGYRPLNLYKGFTNPPKVLFESGATFSTTDAGRVFFNNVGQATTEESLGAEIGAAFVPNDLMYWDKKLLGIHEVGVGFCVPQSSFNIREAIDWSFDYDGYYIDLSYTDDNGDLQESHIEDAPIHESGTINAIAGVAGEEPWNTGVLEDGDYVGVMENFETSHFVGVAEGPTGEAMPYLRAGNKLFVLDFYARQITPIELGAEGRLVSGVVHQGEVMVTDGWNVFAYSPKGNYRNIGFPKKQGFGIPPNMVVNGAIKKITNIFSVDSYLCALVVDVADSLHPNTTLFRHNGLGWHQVGAVMEDFQGAYGFVLDAAHNQLSNGRAIIIPGTTGAVVGINDVTPPVGYYQFTLPNLTHQSTVGLDTFGASGAAFITGWYDGGFLDIQGTLLRLNIDAWSLTTTETVKVEYRLDNDESTPAVWTQLVDVNGAAAVFDSTHRTLYFPAAADPRKGIQFRTVQFRIELTRGADATRSPELRSLQLTYIKTPELRTGWTMAIDVNRMIERSQGVDTTFYVNAAPATLESVWAKLRDLWNTHHLLECTVPNVQESFFVRITDMPLTLDDFRSAVAGQGQCTIQVLEVVGDEPV